MVWDHIKWAIGPPQRRIGLRGVAVLLTDYQVCRGYGDPHGDSHGYGYGYEVGMGMLIPSPRQPWTLPWI